MARQVPLNYRNLTGRFSSKKSDKYSHFESSLERDALLLADMDPNVSKFNTQPLTIEFTHNNKARTYTPDLLIEYKDGSKLLIEIKFRKDLKENWAVLKPKFKAAIKYCRSQPQTKFKILTEVEIRTEQLKNAKFLKNLQIKPITHLQLEDILNLMRNKELNTPRKVLDECSKDANLRAEYQHTLWVALSQNLIMFDMSQPLTIESYIWLPTE